MDWKPTASPNALKARANLYQQIRLFFAEQNVLEVDTPLLGNATITDPYIESLSVEQQQFLQTSPRILHEATACCRLG